MGLMDLFRKLRPRGSPKFIAGQEIEEVAECANCAAAMYMPVAWVDTEPASLAVEGAQCQACESYICANCLIAVHSGRFRCCPEVVNGVTVCSYFPASAKAESEGAEREMAEKGEPAIHVRAEEAEEKRGEWLDKASELEEEGQHEEAIEYFDRIIRAGLDRNGYVHSRKASELAELGRHGEAIECLEEALRLDPDSGGYALELGQVLYTAGGYDEARSAFERAAANTLVYGESDRAKDWLARLDQEGH